MSAGRRRSRVREFSGTRKIVFQAVSRLMAWHLRAVNDKTLQVGIGMENLSGRKQPGH